MNKLQQLSLYFSSAASIYFFYYNFFIAKKPKVYAGNKKIKQFLFRYVQTIHQKFYPTLFSWGGRIQTILSLTRRPTNLNLPYKREILNLKDGGQIGLDFFENKEITKANIGFGDPKRLTVIIFPGITSSSTASYVQTFALAAQKGFANVVIFNNRGLGGVSLKTPRLYSGSNYEDFQETIQYVSRKYPNDRLMAIGCSLGGMVLSHYLIEERDEARRLLDCALVVSIVWEAHKGQDAMERYFYRIFNTEITKHMKGLVKKHQSVLEQRPNTWDFKKIYEAKTLREFDRLFMVPQFGFKDLDAYFDSVTINGKINKFSIPVFALQAADDPLFNPKYLPLDEASAEGSNLALVLLDKGGHLGFLTNNGFLSSKPKTIHYAERFITDLVQAVRVHGNEILNKRREENENSNSKL